jgi:sulfatase maturation enzyme AslB (radical SAM superfamily)
MDNNLLWLALTGGEITSFNLFPEVVQLIKQYSQKLRILTFTTNGLLPQRILEFALLMKTETNCDIFITISLDGDEETHDSLRGVKGNYAKCMETYNLLQQNGIECHFGITVSDGNYNFIKNAFKKYQDKIKAVTIFHSGGIFLNKEGEDSKERDRRIIESLKEIYQHYKITSLGEILIKLYIKVGILFMNKERKTNIIPCDVGLSSAHLMANGSLLQCMYLPPIKKIDGLFQLSDYHSPEAQLMIDEIKKDRCPHCWMSCYGPHSMLQAPLTSASILLKQLK